MPVRLPALNRPGLMSTTQPMYDEMAPWWPLLSAPADYEEEASQYADALLRHCEGACASLLELGSGGGNNASWMKARFERITLVDLAPGMLEVSRALNPECEHVVGDMRSVRLGRVYDCVFIHDAICYMSTRDDLALAIETARVHCRAGSAAVFAPDFVRENFQTGTEHGGEDSPDGRGLRWLAWTWDPDPADTTYIAHYAFLLREADGAVRVAHDRHIEGLFTEADWLSLLRETGFEGHTVRYRHPEVDYEIVYFVGVAR